MSQPAPAVQPAPVAAQPAPALVVPEPVAPEPVVAPLVQPAAPAAEPAPRPALPETSVVAPLPSPKNAPAYANRRPPAELSLQPEIEVAAIQPDVIPPFPEPYPAGTGDEPVLKTVDEWAAAWARRDEEAYLAAYDAGFVPQGGGSRSDWEKRRRLLLGLAKNIDLKIDSPLVDRADDGTATVTFNQFYRSDRYRDAVVKQLRLAERDGRWLIVEEKVLSILRGARP
jgi:outer membrane protein assembly factor BamE